MARISFAASLGLIASLTGCSNFIDGMAGLGQLNYDANGNAYVPEYPDETRTLDIGGEDCFGYVSYGRQNNNTFVQVVNTSDRNFDYTVYWTDGTTSPGFAQAHSSDSEIWKINPHNTPERTVITCR